MPIKFAKMHGLGNDFMVIDAINQTINPTPAQIKAWSDRHTGIGFDQCLFVEPSANPAVDFHYRIFNADGHEVGQCGNGARCLARFLQHYKLTKKSVITVATSTTQLQLQLHADSTVTVDMGKPTLAPHTIPINHPTQSTWYSIPLPNHHYDVHAINVGNPHAVLLLNDLLTPQVNYLGEEISTHPLFPEQTNVGFMQIVNKHEIKLRVYERGAGETQACGSGAVAAVALGRLYHELAEKVTVNLPGGQLTVSWPDMDKSIYLTGPAVFVYEGYMEIKCAS